MIGWCIRGCGQLTNTFDWLTLTLCKQETHLFLRQDSTGDFRMSLQRIIHNHNTVMKQTSTKKTTKLHIPLSYIHSLLTCANKHQDMWPWTTKPVMRVIYSKLRFIHHLNKWDFEVWTIFGWDTTICKSGIWGCKKNHNRGKSPLKLSKLSP